MMLIRVTLISLLVANSIAFAPSSHPTSKVNVINNDIRGCASASPLFMSVGENKPKESKFHRIVPQARRPQTDVGMRYRSDDWIRNLLSIPRSYLLRRIKSHLLFDQLVCICTLLARKKLGWKWLSIPLLGHQLLGGFLGLLIVFRTNSGYSRFVDARGYWAHVSSTCRCLALESVSHLRPYAPKSAEEFERLLVAFPDVLAYTCLAGNKKARLPPFEWELLYGKAEVSDSEDNGQEAITDELLLDPCTVILHKMHKCLYDASYEFQSEKRLFDMHLVSMGEEVNHLSDAVSGCEKIVDTPVPLSYSRHTSRFLTIWCGILPLAIAPDLGWLAVPLMGTVSWLLYGLEEIGHLIEQPFVPVTEKPSYLISDDVMDDDRASKTQPYDIGLPICSVAEKVRKEVEKILRISGKV
mmetsp:Transcript_9429/g.21269  ORF Transcript_9429/g.21269 Transcript_9429/m.21269 type:complete len:412 (-) Transcript_9429:229-1464(-)|eukprot:CAMPEP_0172304562 /NCGR_PEP_ID=MMETSP1058-20130122/5964_1 /TAXON_ID=83371 /ORGANISM="Detonula confervacea, Strain CCMP 353" /LENGTH=411 /DNA_ID=CAMNT_0013015849 /DNA_START=181 /DNA_END=1416 /DNA_ORIENTATION=+